METKAAAEIRGIHDWTAMIHIAERRRQTGDSRRWSVAVLNRREACGLLANCQKKAEDRDRHRIVYLVIAATCMNGKCMRRQA